MIAAVAAETLEQAQDGIRAIKVEYEVLEHFVDEDDLKGAEAAKRTKKPQESKKGDVDQALNEGEGRPQRPLWDSHHHPLLHGAARLALRVEPGRQRCLTAHLSTQNVSGTGGQYAGPLGVDQSKVTIICNYIGGGFGSKFAVDEWGVACAKMAKEAGRPVRFLLDRATELKIGRATAFRFCRCHHRRRRRTAGSRLGTACTGASNGIKGGTVSVSQYPYVFDFENRNRKAIGIETNTGDSRAWRAPNHPQLCAMTCTVIDDLAAKLGMDSYDVFMKNLDQTRQAGRL